jgi:Glutaredoxin-like domain (DUF836)
MVPSGLKRGQESEHGVLRRVRLVLTPSRMVMVQEDTLVSPHCESMSLLRVTIVSRDDCHLCRVVHRVAEQLRQEVAFDLAVIEVDSDPRLVRQYGDRVPVVLLDGREAISGKVTGGELRTAIKKARWRNPISRILSRVKLALTRG